MSRVAPGPLPMSEYLELEAVTACPVCASLSRDVVDAPASVTRCRACGHRYVHSRPTQREIARGYSGPTLLSAITPLNLGREMLVVGHREP